MIMRMPCAPVTPNLAAESGQLIRSWPAARVRIWDESPENERRGRVRRRLSPLDWKAICGMRDVLIHDYIGVDLDEVWNVASSRIPELQKALQQFLAGGSPGSTPVS
jgi:hypothetical protein